MRNYGSIYTRFWIHSEIQSLTDSAKLLAAYLLTGPHTNMLGCFRLPLGYIGEDLHWAPEVVTASLEALLAVHFVHYDDIYHWVFLQKFLTWNPIENPNQGKNIIHLFEQVPKQTCFFNHLAETLLKINKYLEEDFKSQLSALLSTHTQMTCETKIDEPPILIQPIESIDPVVINLPLNDQSEFPIVQSKVAEWQTLYPAVDVLQSLRHIRAWNDANPSRRKTKSGILRHIVAWLSKEQNQSKPSFSTDSKFAAFERIQANNLDVAQKWLRRSNPSEQEIIISPEP
jgi:hypothetical protein